ncbi:ABC-type Fe(3+)-hydroxamate transport system periplasmic component [Methanonatronarchaeum thermophilum]|uniref:ABC-type Fe(3+)-hydroxamate transport system periplasmic component n=1 Tax=Methanonatronarchaeum thermophilum TaxID=1927129 RepID=A0A1Y3GCS4_9EURY|nr:ABC transporter substrate-binding protein [Methanonatronarchaeum thermophilum]OUJ19047.1 ABC-type Fe(3+)-hydroxamate transport system periplasmic component [Methanonatronarchaeum thermophilum]
MKRDSFTRRGFIKLAGGLAVTLSVGGCLNPGFQQKESREIVDQYGREISIPSNVEKIVAVGSGALRLVSYMLSTDLVVGVEEFEINDGRRPYVMANPGLQELPNIGPQHRGDAEKILSVNPDVVIASDEFDGDVEGLSEKTGLPVVEVKYGDIVEGERDTFYNALDIIGEIVGREERASEVKDVFNSYIFDLEERFGEIDLDSRIYIGGVGRRGEQGLTATIAEYPSLSLIGLENMDGRLGDKVPGEHVSVDREKLVEFDPEMIFVDGAGLQLVKEDLSRDEFKGLKAVENEDVYSLLPYNYYNTQFENVLINSYFLGSHLAGDSFDDVDLEVVADDIFEDVLGERVFQSMHDEFGVLDRVEV